MAEQSEKAVQYNSHYVGSPIIKDAFDPTYNMDPGAPSFQPIQWSTNSCTSTSDLQMTPPATPIRTFTDPSCCTEIRPPAFHNFLRAFHPFHPNNAFVDHTVTLAFDDGDIILIHSIQTNGWADGTILTTGERGWLPTNFCSPYEPEPIQNLLIGLLNFWDKLRFSTNTEKNNFPNQEFMRGIIAGVRYLLERTNCLTRESALVRENVLLRRNRKALLSELSSLVKNSKILQEFVDNSSDITSDIEEITSITDTIMLNAFRLITRGAKFLDIWTDYSRSRPLNIKLPTQSYISTVENDARHPPSPEELTPMDSINGLRQEYERTSPRKSSISFASYRHKKEPLNSERPSIKGNYASYSHPPPTLQPMSLRPTSFHTKRQSASHRLSASIPVAQRQNFVSGKLNCSHDTLLSFLGSFIGRLHLQLQSPADLISAVQQFVRAGRELLTVVRTVCEHDTQSAQALMSTKNAMEERIQQLVMDAQQIIVSSGESDTAVVMPEHKARLLMASTGCVKAAGECVAKTKFVLEKIGDFEFSTEICAQDNSYAPVIGEYSTLTSRTNDSDSNQVSPHCSFAELQNSPPFPLCLMSNYEKPLPEVPTKSPSLMEDGLSNLESLNPLQMEPQSAPSNSNDSVKTVMLPPVQSTAGNTNHGEDVALNVGLIVQEKDPRTLLRQSSSIRNNEHPNSIYLNSIRNSETSMFSLQSTRATTPDPLPRTTRNKISVSDLSLCSSHTSSAEDHEEAESKLLQKTYAHELLINKDGAITGGTLPALVERLTINDSTPDSLFVSTFYLTFRSFVTPEDFASTLIDRFEYAKEDPQNSSPVRLRVYNVMKGWLESHWRESTDRSALDIIEKFARTTLIEALPAAGQRILELTAKAADNNRKSISSSTISLNIKTNSRQSLSSKVSMPNPVINKTVMSLLKGWKIGGNNVSILDIDPLEIARQLSLKWMKAYCAILPEELLGANWTKCSGSNSPNIKTLVLLATDLSNLVADTVLQYEEAKKRANVIKHWIKIAQKCLEFNNYDTLIAIICGVNSSTIVRLKKTWEAVSQRRKDLLNSLAAVVEPSKNYAGLRRRLHDHVPPCLPFLGMFLTDLTFVDAGNSPTRQLPVMGNSGGLKVINFDKYTRTAKIISDLQRFQLPYRFIEVPEIQVWITSQLNRVRNLTDDSQDQAKILYRKSLLLEPRESHTSGRSPMDGSFNSTHREKFDLFAWAYKDRSSSIVTSIFNG
ncbi:hypothetical protein GcM3_201004 [Golovinomyces cichoracearum]|uniref:Ras guanine nucleotide exchange factor A n=1 Tax=Golovinomyces cichoracearum TaxID=62708 RepID=A0A420HDJ6_9PEZI|nr:hypothetical protein GcM3_201004 [Golovinomyces cichoracearum]